jgi:predicted RND superfamily exporter protein
MLPPIHSVGPILKKPKFIIGLLITVVLSGVINFLLDFYLTYKDEKNYELFNSSQLSTIMVTNVIFAVLLLLSGTGPIRQEIKDEKIQPVSREALRGCPWAIFFGLNHPEWQWRMWYLIGIALTYTSMIAVTLMGSLCTSYSKCEADRHDFILYTTIWKALCVGSLHTLVYIGAHNADQPEINEAPPPPKTPRQNLACALFCGYIFVALPICATGAILFLENTKLTFSPPPDSVVQTADNFLKKSFDNLDPAPAFVVITSKTTSVVEGPLGDAVKTFSSRIVTLAYSDPKYAKDVHDIQGYFVSKSDFVKAGYLSSDNRTTMISVNYHSEDDVIGQKFSVWFQDEMHKSKYYDLNNTDLEMKITGLGLLVNDITTGASGDLLRIDMISLPIAVMVLAYCLKSLRVLYIPLACLPLSISLSFTIMLPLSYMMDVSSFTPDMMGAMISALNIDYSLFILSRFQEQVHAYQLFDLKNPNVQYTIVKKSVELAAHNILVSGVTVAMANAGIAIFPMDMLRTIGIGCCFAVLSTMLISMTVTPLMLFIFFEYFAKQPKFIPESVSKTVSGLYMRMKNFNDAASEVDMESNMNDSAPLLNKQDIHASNYRNQLISPWFRLSLFTTRHPIPILLAVVALGTPLFVLTPTLKVTFDLFVQVPRDGEHLPAFKDMMSTFGGGRTSPYYFPLDSGKASGVESDDFFYAMHDTIYKISAKCGQNVRNFNSIAMIPNYANPSALPVNLTWTYVRDNILNNMIPLWDPYRYFWNKSVSHDNRSTLIQLYTTFPPIGTEAKPFLDNLAPWIDDFKDPRFIYIGIAGGGSDSWAVMNWVMEWFPYQVGLTFAVIFLFIAIAFKSIAVPLRMLFTVSYTVAFTYGLAVLIFQYEWLDSVWTALKDVEGVFWIIPVQCFTVICGLALDYDVFLLSRVIEYRKKGFSDTAALCKAVWKTGRIISFAGCIMAIAFSSLVASQIMVMNQAGLMLAVAVVLDTFVIRTLFTPALMSMIPNLAFWPAKMPAGHRGVEDMGEDDPDEGENDALPA